MSGLFFCLFIATDPFYNSLADLLHVGLNLKNFQCEP
nr:MAG TPA: hypothetical protein [Caudoviricetes sp.]